MRFLRSRGQVLNKNLVDGTLQPGDKTHMRGVTKIIVIDIVGSRFWTTDHLFWLFENLVGIGNFWHSDVSFSW